MSVEHGGLRYIERLRPLTHGIVERARQVVWVLDSEHVNGYAKRTRSPE
jgi:hypothetical protein